MDKLTDLLKMGLDGASLRHKMLANNIANLDTPGYKRQDVDFMTSLRSAAKGQSSAQISLKVSDKNHIKESGQTGSRPFKVIAANRFSYRNDKNSVDIDTEMAELAKNDIYYNTLTQRINGRFRVLKDVIDKGSR